MVDTILEEILKKHRVPRIKPDFRLGCLFGLDDESHKSKVLEDLDSNGYGTYWNTFDYFNDLMFREKRIAARIAHAARNKIPIQHHRKLVTSGEAVFLNLARTYGLIIPKVETQDPNAIYL